MLSLFIRVNSVSLGRHRILLQSQKNELVHSPSFFFEQNTHIFYIIIIIILIITCAFLVMQIEVGDEIK